MTEGETALVLRVPDAEPIVGRWRATLDSSAALGVPAHVTVLYPWIRFPQLSAQDLAAITAIAAAADPIELSFPAMGAFPDVLWLDPQPQQPILSLIAAVAARWPERPPYGGAFGDAPVPHLTVAASCEPAELGHVIADIERRLPFMARVAELTLLVRRPRGWAIDATFPFRAQSSGA